MHGRGMAMGLATQHTPTRVKQSQAVPRGVYTAAALRKQPAAAGAREGAGVWIVREEGGAIGAQAAAEPGARSAFHGSCTPSCCIRSAVSAVGCVASEGFCSRSALR